MIKEYVTHIGKTRITFRPICMVYGTIIVDKTTTDEDAWEILDESCQHYTSESPDYIAEMNPALRSDQCKALGDFLHRWSNAQAQGAEGRKP